MSDDVSFLRRAFRRLRKLVLWMFMLILVMAIPMNVAVEYSNTPQFCGSCHIMDPYYDSWKHSAHKDAKCTDCHFPPSLKGKIGAKFQGFSQLVSYVTGTAATRPTAHVEDGSCTQCHPVEKLGLQTPFGKIHFDHQKHFQASSIGRELRCTSCHVQITRDEHMSIDKRSCVLCHMKDQPQGEAVGGCTACHTLPDKTIQGLGLSFNHKEVLDRGMRCGDCHAGITTGTGGVARDRCLSCHSDPEQLAVWKSAHDDKVVSEELHASHVSRGSIECRSCHDEIRHGKDASAAATPVGHQMNAGACSECHKEGHAQQSDFMAGRGGRDVPATPSLMQKCGLTCQACHGSATGGHALVRDNRCIACHGAGVRGMLDGWRTSLAAWNATAEKNLAAVGAALGQDAPEKAKLLFDDAKVNAALVGGKAGVHNIAFSQSLHAKVFEQLGKAAEAAGKKLELEKPAVFASESGDCRSCHAGAEAIVTRFERFPFPHQPHLGKANMGCDDCHQTDGADHGKLAIDGANCAECHHEDEASDCTKCHEAETKLFGGHGLGALRGVPDVMSAQVPCVACHADRKTADQKAMHRSKCVECHEEKYGPMFDEWLKEEGALVAKLADALITGRRLLVESDRAAPGHAEAKRLVDDADLVLEGLRDARFVHNPAYAREAVDQALKGLDRLRALVGER